MDRLTDKRFVGEGFYQPKNHEERLEIFTKVPHLKDIYNRLAEYENTGLTPEQVKQMQSKIYCENEGCIYFGENNLCTLSEISHDDVGVCVSVRWEGDNDG